MLSSLEVTGDKSNMHLFINQPPNWVVFNNMKMHSQTKKRCTKTDC